MTIKLFVQRLLWAVLFSGLAVQVVSGAESTPATDLHDTATDAPVSSGDDLVSLRIPLYSERFTDVPVALVNDEPITIGDLAVFKSSIRTSNGGEGASEKPSRDLEILNRLLVSRLVVLEARTIGLDETDEYQDQLENFVTKLLQKELIARHLEGLKAEPGDVREIYEQISREVRLDSITFPTGPEAQLFLNDVREGEDFDMLASTHVEEGTVALEVAEQYVSLKDLKQQVAQQAYAMSVGELSNVYRTKDGFLIFRLADARFVEDPAAEQEANKLALSTLREEKATEFVNNLADRYFMIDEELYESLDFDRDLDTFLKDDRALAIAREDDSIVISVADLAAKLKMEFFHGIDKAKNENMINTRKERVFSNMLFEYSAKWEADSLGLDQEPEINRNIKEFERATLFSSFMGKVIFPDIKLSADEVRSYYQEHLDQYSTPKMVKIKSLIFSNRQDAQSSLDKLKKGADFKWVSANSSGFVSPEAEGVLPFDQNLLSLTSLPDELQHMVDQVSEGSTLLYAPDDEQFSYVLVVEKIFPSKPQPFENVKDEAAKAVFNRKSQEMLDEYVAQLMDAYETRIFVVEETQ